MVFQPGDNIHRNLKAAEMNGLLEMLRWFRLEGRKIGGPGHRQKNFDGEIYVKNTTSSDVAAFGVLALGDPAIDPTQVTHEKFNRITIDGTTPSTTTPHYGKFAVLQEPAKANDGIARAIVCGQTYVTLNIGDADDGAAEIENNQTGYLKTGAWGTARILWKQSGTGGNKLGIVLLGSPILTVVGKADGTIALDATNGVVDVWDPTFSGATGQEITGCHNFTAEIDSGAKVAVSVILPKGTPIVTPLSC